MAAQLIERSNQNVYEYDVDSSDRIGTFRQLVLLLRLVPDKPSCYVRTEVKFVKLCPTAVTGAGVESSRAL